MLVVSFDVGLRNLAECVITEGCRILYWQVTDVAQKNVKSLTTERAMRCVLRYLESRRSEYEALGQQHAKIHVWVENQPPRSSNKLKATQAVLWTFFSTIWPQAKVRFASPRTKLGYDPSEGATDFGKIGTHRLNKLHAIAKTRWVLQRLEPTHIVSLEQSNKQDDLADALLQGIACSRLSLPPSTA